MLYVSWIDVCALDLQGDLDLRIKVKGPSSNGDYGADSLAAAHKSKDFIRCEMGSDLSGVALNKGFVCARN